MGFRDDNLASHARIEALERDLERLKKENDALHKGTRIKERSNAAVGVLGVLAIVALGGAYYSGFTVSGHAGEQVGIAVTVLGVLFLTTAAAGHGWWCRNSGSSSCTRTSSG